MRAAQLSCSWALALLVLWSLVSVVVVVVWASWPLEAGLEGCRAGLRSEEEKMEGARVVQEKERREVEREIQQSHNNQTQLQLEIHNLLLTITLTNSSLTDQLQQQVVLKENLTDLQNKLSISESELNSLKHTHSLNQDQIWALQVNVTGEKLQLDSCQALCEAAHSQQVAAESERKVCQLKSKYLHKHLESCELQD